MQGRKIFQGLKISIENKKGSVRSGVSKDGKTWATKMKCHYGYILGTIGTDGDHVDVFLGPVDDASNVYVIHQNNPKTGKFDEDKCMLGFENKNAAKKAYLSHYDNPKFYGGMTILSMDTFKKKLLNKGYKLTASSIDVSPPDRISGLQGVPLVKTGKSKVPDIVRTPEIEEQELKDLRKKGPKPFMINKVNPGSSVEPTSPATTRGEPSVIR